MVLKDEIRIGDVYGYDVECLTTSIHKPTRTVRILEVHKKNNDNILLTVECQQTGQLFVCGSHMITTINRIRKMYDGYKNTIIRDGERDYQLYSYNQTLARMEDILFQMELANL